MVLQISAPDFASNGLGPYRTHNTTNLEVWIHKYLHQLEFLIGQIDIYWFTTSSIHPKNSTDNNSWYISMIGYIIPRKFFIGLQKMDNKTSVDSIQWKKHKNGRVFVAWIQERILQTWEGKEVLLLLFHEERTHCYVVAVQIRSLNLFEFIFWMSCLRCCIYGGRYSFI